MSKTELVVGGGIAGLYAAHLLKAKHPERDVVVIEQAPEVGGLLRSFDYGENGVFDYGIHTFYETGNAEIDGFFQSVLPEGGWRFLTGYARDLGGSSFEGVMQYQTPYPSLMHLPQPRRAGFVADFIDHLGAFDAPGDNAMSYARARFGPALAEAVVRPAIEARQGMPAEQVHWLAVILQGMGRMALLPEAAIESLNQSPGFDARLAFPDQLSYPEKYLSGRRAYYPARFGLGRFIQALTAQLEARGVMILTSAQIEMLESDNGRCRAVQIRDAAQQPRRFEVDNIWWSVGLPALAATLKLDMKTYAFDPPQRTVICNLLSRQKPNCGGVYYAYSHGHERIHRISFGYNYSDDVGGHGGFPISVELVYPRGSDLDAAQIAGDAEHWLRREEILQPGNEITFARTEILRGGGFPSLSCKNIASMQAMRADILSKGLRNLTPIGVLSKEDLFFQFDIIQHIHALIAGGGQGEAV